MKRPSTKNKRDVQHFGRQMMGGANGGMMKAKLLAGAAVLGLLFPVMPASSHHAFAAEFDAKKSVKVSGTVTKLEWSNPHAWLYLDVKDESGKLTSWSFELGSPNGLIRQGWRRSSLKEGDQVTVEGFAAKDGSNTANAHNVTLPDGRKIFAGSQVTDGGPAK
jgi:uncharacterized protein DUF6152